MGLGKSRIIIEDLLRRENCNLLLIAPKGVYTNWIGEIQKYTPDELKPTLLISHWVSGASKKEKEEIQKVLKPWPGIRRILLMNVESFSGVKEAIKTAEIFLDSGPCMMVIDESTRLKSMSSNRTKAIIDIGSRAEVRRIMSGLVTPNSPMDLYSQFYFLDWRILGFRNYYSFRSRHAVLKKMMMGGRSFDTIVGYQNIEELQGKVSKSSFRALKENCLNLPPKIYLERSVELSLEQSKAYKDLQKKATTLLNSGEHVTSTTAISLMLRLHQIVCGHVRDDLGNVQEIDASPRLNALMETLEECQGKAIIWANFRHSLMSIRELITKEYGEHSLVEYWGDTSTQNREIAKHRFQGDPKCRWFLANQQTAGLGLTLVSAKTVVYYSNTFSLEDRLQSEDRTHRAGQTESVTYVDLVSKGTVDEKILKALRSKLDISSQINGESIRTWIR